MYGYSGDIAFFFRGGYSEVFRKVSSVTEDRSDVQKIQGEVMSRVFDALLKKNKVF